MTRFKAFHWVRLLLPVVAVCGALPRPVHGHAAAPRSQDVSIANAVSVTPKSIVVKQTQTFKGQFGKTIWDMLDADKNGKLTDKEKKAFEPQCKAFYTDHSGLRVNWALMVPNDVKADLSAWPAKKPSDFDKANLSFTLTADYGYTPSPLDLVELVIPNLNAHQISTNYSFDPALKPLRINTGSVNEQKNSVDNMVQTDGHPDSFSVIVHKPQPALAPAPAPAPAKQPARPAAPAKK